MTQAQKIAKVKFKQAIAYRGKTGVSLKQAFAHIYGKKKVSVVKKKSAPKKKIGASNIPKAGANLGKKLYDKYDYTNDFSDQLSELIGLARDMGYSYAQTKVAIKYIVDGVVNYYEDEF